MVNTDREEWQEFFAMDWPSKEEMDNQDFLVKDEHLYLRNINKGE